MQRISVIVPIYNVERYLRRCLDSILHSTYSELEVICINDGSTDNSLEILRKYAEKDHRVVVVDQPNAGVSAARNLGVTLATGKYIAFIDGDDWIHPQYFEILLHMAETENADISIVGETKAFSEDGKNANIDRNIRWDMLSVVEAINNYRVKQRVWGRLYTSKIMAGACFAEDLIYGEDVCFNLEMMLSKKNIRICYTETPLYFYFMRSDSAVHSLPPRAIWPTVAWFVTKIKTEQWANTGVFVREAMKTMFSFRYLTMYQQYKKSEIKEAISFCTKKLYKAKDINAMTKVQFGLMAYGPQIYRLFRICNDRSMLDWEKTERARKKKEELNSETT